MSPACHNPPRATIRRVCQHAASGWHKASPALILAISYLDPAAPAINNCAVTRVGRRSVTSERQIGAVSSRHGSRPGQESSSRRGGRHDATWCDRKPIIVQRHSAGCVTPGVTARPRQLPTSPTSSTPLRLPSLLPRAPSWLHARLLVAPPAPRARSHGSPTPISRHLRHPTDAIHRL